MSMGITLPDRETLAGDFRRFRNTTPSGEYVYAFGYLVGSLSNSKDPAARSLAEIVEGALKDAQADEDAA